MTAVTEGASKQCIGSAHDAAIKAPKAYNTAFCLASKSPFYSAGACFGWSRSVATYCIVRCHMSTDTSNQATLDAAITCRATQTQPNPHSCSEQGRSGAYVATERNRERECGSGLHALIFGRIKYYSTHFHCSARIHMAGDN